MSGNDSGLSDEVKAELNPAAQEPDFGPQAQTIPKRPADGAGKETWVDYVVALGADRTFVTSDTEHFAGDGYETEPGLSRPQLIQLAYRLGG